MFDAAPEGVRSLAPLPENTLLFRYSLSTVWEAMPIPLRVVVWSWFCQKMLLATNACMLPVAEVFAAYMPIVLNAIVLLITLVLVEAGLEPSSLRTMPLMLPITPSLTRPRARAEAPEGTTPIPVPPSLQKVRSATVAGV